MAQASRFPSLALPFSIVGAAAGWLSAGLLANPLLKMTHPGKQVISAVCAAVLTAATGMLIRRWCIGKRYAYELDAPPPDELSRSDTWPRHITAVLLTGTLTGTLVAILCDTYRGPLGGAGSGLCCALAFVPVCIAVILSARKAQRARLGSIVAGSDHRAVWGILMTALAITTLEAIPDWPASTTGDVEVPLPALGLAAAAGVVIAALLAADVLALRKARRAVSQGLTQREPGEVESADSDVPRVDLGLGEDAYARVVRSASAYRGRDRTLALVQGSPEQAVTALRRALTRGAVGLAMVAVVTGAHMASQTALAERAYCVLQCNRGDAESCTRAADLVRPIDFDWAVSLYREACSSDEANGCVALAEIYEADVDQSCSRTSSLEECDAAARVYHSRACDAGVHTSCVALSRSSRMPQRPW